MSNCPSAVSSPPQQLNVVPESLNKLAESMSVCESLLNDLDTRLLSVLASAPADETCKSDLSANSSPMAGQLAALNGRLLHNVIDKINDIMVRLEI